MRTIVFQIRFQKVLVHEETFPTLEAGWSTGGCLAPKVLYWEKSEDMDEDDLHTDRQEERMPGEGWKRNRQ